MFGRKKAPAPAFDMTGKIPTIRSSICTGEQTVGFKDIYTGKFTEVMLIRDRWDLQEFMEKYGVREEDIKREW